MLDRATGTLPDTTTPQAGSASADNVAVLAAFGTLKDTLHAEIGDTAFRS